LFLIKDLIVLALIFFILAAGMDFVDGSVARFRKIDTKKGAYLDTVFDRYVEAIFLFGLLFLPFPVVIFPSYIWIFLILFGAMMTTYAKSAAKEKELLEGELKGGIFSRAERLIMSFIILLSLIVAPQYTIYLIILMAVLSNIAAIQRIYRSLRL
jgi:phosphatidylglycerophosphate synthase